MLRDMGRMIFDLTDEDREALERLRAHRGERSQAETLRGLIREAAGKSWQTMPRTKVGKVQAALLSAESAAPSSSIPLAGTFKRPIYQKGTKK